MSAALCHPLWIMQDSHICMHQHRVKMKSPSSSLLCCVAAEPVSGSSTRTLRSATDSLSCLIPSPWDVLFPNTMKLRHPKGETPKSAIVERWFYLLFQKTTKGVILFLKAVSSLLGKQSHQLQPHEMIQTPQKVLKTRDFFCSIH